ncbi:MAG TPA: hypothetical protein PKD91_04800 [Bacteroidia bacterium]|nr:hypothetical protein [Bacteroidia bacterium]
MAPDPVSMKKKECPSCAMMIHDKADVCPICGYEFPKRNKIISLVAIILLVVIVVYFLISVL